MKKGIRRALGLGVCIALATTLGAAATAYAGSSGNFSGTNNIQSDGTYWEAPTSELSGGSTITKDGKLYKVISFYNSIWCKDALEFLGLNSVMLCTTNASGSSSTYGDAISSLMGIWASDINESPDAYNYNYFYNLWANATGLGTLSACATISAANDSTCGTNDIYKYRPEIILYAQAAQTNSTKSYLTKLISGVFVDEDGNNIEDTSDYAAAHDSEYDPVVYLPTSEDESTRIQNSNAFTYLETFYRWADTADSIIKATADYDCKDTDGTTVTSENVNWRNMNSLPRSNRYNDSVYDCALALEKTVKGSTYYVLNQINEGNVSKKKVAYVVDDPSSTDTTVTVVAYDYVEKVAKGMSGGAASFSPLTVNQLGATEGDDLEMVEDGTYAIGNMSQSAVAVLMPYKTYKATADDLATCDFIYIVDGSMDQSDWQTWIKSNLTNQSTDISNLQYILTIPSTVMGSNFTHNKMIFGIYAVNCFYSELFPNMSLMAYFYDNCYHLKTDKVAMAMNYSMSAASMPEGCSLSEAMDSYDKDQLDSKFAQGLAYYNAVVAGTVTDNEGTVTRITKSIMLDGSAAPTGLGGWDTEQDVVYDGSSDSTTLEIAENPFSSFAPSDYFQENPGTIIEASVEEAAELATQTIKVSTKAKTIKAKKLAKKAQTFKIGASAKGKITCTKKSGSKKITITKAGKITVKKGTKKGTYKIKVKIKAKATSKYAAATKTITVKVTVK